MQDPDPENLRRTESPAVVEVLEQGPVFVADAAVLDSGWLTVKHWDGSKLYLPPRRVGGFERVEKESYKIDDRDGSPVRYRVADEQYRALAQQWTAESETAAEEVIA